jgi:sensor histidine kinase YesM
LTVIGIGLSVPIMEWCFNSQTVPHFLLQWALSVVYAAAIGGLLWAFMPAVWVLTSPRSPVLRWGIRSALIVFACALGCLAAGYVAQLAVPALIGSYWDEFLGSFRLSLLISVATTTFTGLYETLQHKLQRSEVALKAEELDRERALKLATEAQLASLESRIHPHFLFNTINSVSSLIHEDPERAEKLLMQMAALLRFSLDSGQNRLVPLELELRIVRDYLDIESARFGLRLRHEIAVPAEFLAALVPPLALQTLVENSLKYAVNARRHGATVRIGAQRDERLLRLVVSDDGPGFSSMELPAGHGLSNLQERLYALFGDQANLDVSSEPGNTSVRLSLPFSTAGQKAAG